MNRYKFKKNLGEIRWFFFIIIIYVILGIIELWRFLGKW